GHNSFNFADLYSGDLAYTVQQSVDSALGYHVPALYAPGCSGDTNYFDYQGRGLQEHKGLQKATEGVASAIVALYREACTLPEARLGSRKAALYFAQRDVTRHWWKHDMDIKRPSWGEYGPREVERFRVEATLEAT